MAVDASFWAGRRVFLTGHTGFKGGWLALWLQQLGADVRGYALPAEQNPSFWAATNLQNVVDSELADIRDAARLSQSLQAFAPEVVLHLAAQPLVRESYRSPADTYSTNVMGTLNLLEACRQSASVRAVVVVTTDKCYENREWIWPYRETDALGGHDPYSSSKACAEILCASWRKSFFREAGIALATARAGNVIGGGDWSGDRLLPDVLSAWQDGRSVTLRYPNAVRPWQHVLEPLNGYLSLARALLEHGQEYASAWNFGPDAGAMVSVGEVVAQLAECWPGGGRWQVSADAHVHEAGLLALDSSKARTQLGWRAHWDLNQSLQQTLDWHQAWVAGEDMQAFSRTQISAYQGAINE